jgi:hypothetical protein
VFYCLGNDLGKGEEPNETFFSITTRGCDINFRLRMMEGVILWHYALL